MSQGCNLLFTAGDRERFELDPTRAPTEEESARHARELYGAPLTNRTGQSLTMLDAATLRKTLVLEDVTYPHHGHTAEEYRALAEKLPGVIAALRDGRAPEGEFARCHDAFFGGDPIRIELRTDGSLDVVDGRHRLAACLAAGVDPVVVVRTV